MVKVQKKSRKQKFGPNYPKQIQNIFQKSSRRFSSFCQ